MGGPGEEEEGARREESGISSHPTFFSLFYICHYYITLFWASNVVGTEFGSSPAFLPWKSQRVGSGLSFYYYYFLLKYFLLGQVPHV